MPKSLLSIKQNGKILRDLYTPCAQCKRHESELREGKKLLTCLHCYLERYCSVACQRARWSVHKSRCSENQADLASMRQKKYSEDVECYTSLKRFMTSILVSDVGDIFDVVYFPSLYVSPLDYDPLILLFIFDWNPKSTESKPKDLRNQFTLLRANKTSATQIQTDMRAFGMFGKYTMGSVLEHLDKDKKEWDEMDEKGKMKEAKMIHLVFAVRNLENSKESCRGAIAISTHSQQREFSPSPLDKRNEEIDWESALRTSLSLPALPKTSRISNQEWWMLRRRRTLEIYGKDKAWLQRSKELPRRKEGRCVRSLNLDDLGDEDVVDWVMNRNSYDYLTSDQTQWEDLKKD